jgi:hypothetical protein
MIEIANSQTHEKHNLITRLKIHKTQNLVFADELIKN